WREADASEATSRTGATPALRRLRPPQVVPGVGAVCRGGSEPSPFCSQARCRCLTVTKCQPCRPFAEPLLGRARQRTGTTTREPRGRLPGAVLRATRLPVRRPLVARAAPETFRAGSYWRASDRNRAFVEAAVPNPTTERQRPPPPPAWLMERARTWAWQWYELS